MFDEMTSDISPIKKRKRQYRKRKVGNYKVQQDSNSARNEQQVTNHHADPSSSSQTSNVKKPESNLSPKPGPSNSISRSPQPGPSKHRGSERRPSPPPKYVKGENDSSESDDDSCQEEPEILTEGEGFVIRGLNVKHFLGILGTPFIQSILHLMIGPI